MKTAVAREQFLCPECGANHSLPPSLSVTAKEGTGLRREFVCAGCGREIPAHLAQRWGGISVEEAKKEWRQVYRGLLDPAPVTF